MHHARRTDASLPFLRHLSCVLILVIRAAVLAEQPANNDFVNASPLVGAMGSITQSTIGATREIGEPDHGGEPGGASVWYVWDSPGAGTAEFHLHGSDFDTLLSAYTGSSLEGLTAVAQNDDSFAYSLVASQWLVRGNQSHIRFPARAGVRYHLGVDGAAGQAGNLKLSWNLKAAPTNDNFDTAQVIRGLEGFVSTHNVGATREAGEPSHAGIAGSASIWFRWTAPAGGMTRFYTLNSLTSLAGPLDTLLAVYTGDRVDALLPVAANDNNGTSVRSLVQFTAIAGATYHIAVDTKSIATNHGDIALTWVSGVPGNNNFSAAQRITGACGVVRGHNTSATRETGEPSIAGNGGGASVWYSWTAPSDGEAMFTTAGSPFLDTTLAVYTGTSINALSLVGENDDVTGGFLDQLSYSRVEFTATAGTTYRIGIDGFRTGTTPATGVTFLQWALDAPVNDGFLTAQSLSGLDGTVTACNTFASTEPGEPRHAANPGGHSVWYQWQPPESGVAVIDLEGSSFDTLLAVYRADGVSGINELTPVAQGNDWFDGFNLHLHSRVEFAVTAGVSYRIAVDGASDGTGYISEGWIVLHHTLSAPPTLRITRLGQNIVVDWDGPCVLESTPVLDHPLASVWTALPGRPPLVVPINPGSNCYFRAVHP